jgi:hypothetical protein
MSEEKTIPMDTLAKVYRKIRDKKAALQTAFDTEVAGLNEQLEQISGAMKDQMLALGLTSVRTDQGTVVLMTKTRYTAQDWDAFKTFIVENDGIDLLEHRIAQTNMAKFLTENPDKIIPGLSSNSEYAVSVRKPTAK